MGGVVPTCDGLGSGVLTCEPGAACDGNDPCDGSQSRSFYERYQLGSVLGKGSQGKVYTCVDTVSGSESAVKVIERSRKNALEAFKRELDIVKACGRSKYLVSFLDHFVSRRFYFIVMEKYASNLRKALKWVAQQCDGVAALNNSAIQNILRQAAGAVRHLHLRTIVHRDVKSQNFLVDVLDVRSPECQVVLTDFGLAHALEPGKTLHHAVGTRKYWPPEVYDGKYGHPMDVFALGVLIFLASTGTFPYANEEKVRTRDIFAEGIVPEYLDPGAYQFMQVTLEKDPSKRPVATDLYSIASSWLGGGGQERDTVCQESEFFAYGVRATSSDVYGSKLVEAKAAVDGPPLSRWGASVRPTSSAAADLPIYRDGNGPTSLFEGSPYSPHTEHALDAFDNCLAQGTDQSPTNLTSDTEPGLSSRDHIRPELGEEDNDEASEENDEKSEAHSDAVQSSDDLANHSYGGDEHMGEWYYNE